MAGYAKISSKGQITLPASIRKHLNVEPGMYLQIVKEEDGVYITAVKEGISGLKGIVFVSETQDFKKIRHQVMEEVTGDQAKAD